VYGAAGEGRVSAAARADYAEAAAVALLEGTPGQVLELGGDDAFTMAEYAAALTVASGTDVVYNDLPTEQYAAVLESVGVPAPMAQVLADSDRGIAAGDLLDTTGTLSTIIGRPTTPLAAEVNAALA
jgi:NAD(P)H dehydrogenase (quinone)